MSAPSDPTMRFRFHRGSLADSMATLRTFRSNMELFRAVEDWLKPGVHHSFPDPKVVRRVSCEPYGTSPDDRIGWARTYIIKLDNMVVGFADRPMDDLPEFA